MALRCESRTGLFRPCSDPAVGVCTFCNRPHCGRHGARYGASWVCSRGRCKMKATVTMTALDARIVARVRNAAGLCGYEGCAGRLPGTGCSLCNGDYCVIHLNSRVFRIQDSRPSPDSPTRYHKERRYLCDRCAGAIDKFRLITLPPIPEGDDFEPERLQSLSGAVEITTIDDAEIVAFPATPNPVTEQVQTLDIMPESAEEILELTVDDTLPVEEAEAIADEEEFVAELIPCDAASSEAVLDDQTNDTEDKSNELPEAPEGEPVALTDVIEEGDATSETMDRALAGRIVEITVVSEAVTIEPDSPTTVENPVLDMAMDALPEEKETEPLEASPEPEIEPLSIAKATVVTDNMDVEDETIHEVSPTPSASQESDSSHVLPSKRRRRRF